MTAKNRAKKEQWKAEMIDVAENLFLSRGYESVSMGDIARESGFYEATLRLFFRDKESLYFAVVMRGMRTLNAMYADHIESEAAGLNELAALGRSICEFSRRYPDYYRLTYGNDPYDTCNGGMFDAVIKCVDGEAIRNEMEPTGIALYLIALSIGIIRTDPCRKAALESAGVDCDRFADDLPIFIGHAIEERRKGCHAIDHAGIKRRHDDCKSSLS
jgi:AcrR family transcriptional regulator